MPDSERLLLLEVLEVTGSEVLEAEEELGEVTIRKVAEIKQKHEKNAGLAA